MISVPVWLNHSFGWVLAGGRPKFQTAVTYVAESIVTVSAFTPSNEA